MNKEAVSPSNVTVIVDKDVHPEYVVLSFSDIEFYSAKDRGFVSFVGPDITGIKQYLEENHDLTVDTSAPLFDGFVNFTRPSLPDAVGRIGGITLPPYTSDVVLTTYLGNAVYGDVVDGMREVTYHLPVVPTSAKRSEHIESLRPNTHKEAIKTYKRTNENL